MVSCIQEDPELSSNLVEIVPQAFLLYQIGLCLAGLLMASVNTAMQSYLCGSLHCCLIGCALFSKFLGHNPLLVDLDELN